MYFGLYFNQRWYFVRISGNFHIRKFDAKLSQEVVILETKNKTRISLEI